MAKQRIVLPGGGSLYFEYVMSEIAHTAEIGPDCARALPVVELPTQCARWSHAQIMAHELTLDAAIEGSRDKAIMALACDPMIRDFKEARLVFDALIEAQGDRLATFRAS